MRPGQTTLTEFEAAILANIAKSAPSIRPHVAKLHVFSREFTGVGSFTKFDCPVVAVGLPDGHIGLEALILLPAVPSGLGAVVWCQDGKLTQLEIYTYGNETWDGEFSGFSIQAA